MAKKIINDIIIPKKSIRQIPISVEKKPIIKTPKVNYRERFDIPRQSGNRKPLNPKFAIWLIALIALLALFFGISLIFSSASIVIKPRIEKLVFNNETYTAKLDGTGLSGLSFEVLKIDKIDEVIVEASEEKVFNQKATGKVLIYNNYSSATQRLINNTRFETTEGKVYRLASSVNVPGTKVVAGKTIPGSVEATLIADQAGEEYNFELADLVGDFKIPGFKGGPRYNSFYARSKTDMTGGLIGKQKIVSATVRKEAEEVLKSNLKENLLKELYSIKPDNYIIFDDSYSIEYIPLSDTEESSNKVKISIKGNLNSVVFNSLKLANFIGTKKIAGFDGLPTNLFLNDNLKITFSAKDNLNLWKNSVIDLKLNGEANLKWLFDIDTIKKDLAGEPADRSTEILSKYKDQVESIQVSFSPVWTKYFPDDLDRIKVSELDE